MALGDLDLDPQQASRAGDLLAGVGEQLATLRNGVGANIEGVNDIRPWGRDELGAAFARSYAESAGLVLQAWTDMAHRMTELGTQIAASARAADDCDHQVAETIAKALDN